MEMLQHIARQQLPLTIESTADVDKVRVLRAAGLVVAMFLRTSAGEHADTGHSARVLAITQAGRQALAAQANPSDPMA